MRKLRALFGSLAMAAGLLAIIASGETNDAVLVADGGSSAQEAAASGGDTTSTSGALPTKVATFGVGDRVALGDWQVEVHEVTDPYVGDNDFLAPDSGNRWLAIDVEVFNVGGEPREVTSIFCFDLQDDLNRNYEQELFSGSTVGAPSGEIIPGSSRRGTIVYEVSSDASGLRLNFKCELFSNGSATIQL